ncbi:Glycerophosphocholine phosphodiesterase GPCPD1 [Merluccius polli]|uniref:Glycerophosphocholine phosphodiesterase GPCPD1 n=1 Tax=Merluccius polli TaxID=89951 RepID=A0AA47MFF5_MERPO|nr:Glycerophosphocholine phosphodiesterase GPCPD1 [Merluccius polli]
MISYHPSDPKAETESAAGSCQVIVTKWETHQQPRTMTPSESHMKNDDGQFGNHAGVDCVDSGWLTCQTEVRLRLHHSKSAPVSITKKKFKKSRFRYVTLRGPNQGQATIKLNLEGYEEEEEEEGDQGLPDPTPLHKMSTTLEISMISSDGYKSRHSQPDCGYALEPSRWTEYTIQTMDPDNLELTFEFFEVTNAAASITSHSYSSAL